MTSSKHPTHRPTGPDDLGADVPPLQDDLKRNPGIGASKGAFARTGVDPEAVKADNTSEGDVLNDGAKGGGVNPDKVGRTNK
jgi:hypothetical protein